MPFVDTREIEIWERLPGWRGRFYRSESMSFAAYEFDAGSTVHEPDEPNR